MTEKKSEPGRKPKKSYKKPVNARKKSPTRKSPKRLNKRSKAVKPSLRVKLTEKFVSIIRLFARLKLSIIALFLAVITLSYTVYLDIEVRGRFEGRLWTVPSKIYARALNLEQGMSFNADALEKELKLLAYEKVANIPQREGQYRRWQNDFELISRGFKDSDIETPSVSIRLTVEDNHLSQIEHLYQPETYQQVRLDPALIGNIYPQQVEDRELLTLKDVPERLIKTLIAVEDRSFYQHFGVNPLAIARAFWVNLKAGESVQGGSTLTQQLVKNLFLSSERSYWRKLNEAIMALLLELRYDKEKILEAYINEVYLGQNKKASIHGFELGSQFYFNKSLNKLSADEGALLIGMIKGPSYYNPRRHKKRSLTRRNTVLKVMREQAVISPLHYEKSVKRELGVVAKSRYLNRRFPAFIDLVKRQLQSRFTSDALKHEGLKIFTSFDPQIQLAAELAVEQSLQRIQYKADDVPLQTAVVITDTKTAEVLALIGDRDTDYQGFNRALDAQRQIGSLIKPAIYLAALNVKTTDEKAFTLSSSLEDTPLSLKFRNGDIWQPQNYDHDFRGNVIFFDALVQSYNVPSVRLGLKIGLEEIVNTLRNLGLQKNVPIYPSMLLGAFELSPFDVANMYQTIAAKGRQQNIHAIRSVMAHDGTPLVFYEKQSTYTIDQSTVFLLNTALHAVTQQGTAKSLASSTIKYAGKTGTTDDLRDSWFAGFSEDKLAVVWVGNDDNLTTGLTGSSGALRLWADIFQAIPAQSLSLKSPENIEYIKVDRKSGLLARFACNNTIKLAFLENRQPTDYADCD